MYRLEGDNFIKHLSTSGVCEIKLRRLGYDIVEMLFADSAAYLSAFTVLYAASIMHKPLTQSGAA